MALTTKLKLRSINIYQVFLRQHTEDGTILSLIEDLPRIKSLGMNVIYLMPIYPIGKENKRGSIGSPYSVRSQREIDSIYGTIEDFKLLVDKAEELELEIMLDMVFNHTSYDALLYTKKPHWYLKENGLPMRKIKDSTDVIDLDFSQKELQQYLIETLLFWINLGVSGFRFDNASLIPLNFWLKARETALKQNPETIFLGESATLDFIKKKREKGYDVLSDGELYQAFDILYDYDTYDEYEAYLNDPDKLNYWLKSILKQESIYPLNYVKLRSLENQYSKRIADLINDHQRLLNITALLAFLKGTMLIYAGQEYGIDKHPNLFEIDKIEFKQENKELKNLLHRISHLRKDNLFQNGNFNVHFQDFEVAVISYENEMSIAYGIFNLSNSKNEIQLDLKDGIYQNILYPNQIKIINRKFNLTEKPMILFAMKKQI